MIARLLRPVQDDCFLDVTAFSTNKVLFEVDSSLTH